MTRKRIIAAAVAAVMAISAMSVSAFAEETSGDTCRSYLTGELVPTSVGRSRPFALMIENDKNALEWQRGTSSASIIYEAMVEGGITRMEAFFEDFHDVPMIMPIRSCRPQFVYYSREFNAYYGHYGQVIYAVPILQMPDSYDIAGIPTGEGGQNYRLNDGSTAYRRDHEGVTGIYTNYDMLSSFVKNAEWPTEYPADYTGHYQFAEPGSAVRLENGESAKVVIPGFVNNHARFDYNEEEEVYYRSEFDSPQLDHGNGKQLSFKNIIIQIGPSHMLDDSYLFTDPAIQGETGEGWYITNGRAERITWRKSYWSADNPILTTITAAKYAFDVRRCDFNVTRYYDSDGNEITLNRGKTFVEIVRSNDASKVVISDDRSIDTHVIDGM